MENTLMPEPDYTRYTVVEADGRIWWQLEVAFKLGAGFIPTADGAHSLIASSEKVKMHEREISAAIQHNELNLAVPPLIEHQSEEGSTRLVEANKFLDWLSQYIERSSSDLSPPEDLACAVRDAIRRYAAEQTEYSRLWEISDQLENVQAELSEWETLRPERVEAKLKKDENIRELRERERRLVAAFAGRGLPDTTGWVMWRSALLANWATIVAYYETTPTARQAIEWAVNHGPGNVFIRGQNVTDSFKWLDSSGDQKETTLKTAQNTVAEWKDAGWI